MFFTDDSKQIYQAWKEEGAQVAVKGIESIDVGRAAEAIIIFAGCRADPAGNCNVTADVHIRTRDRRNLGDFANVPVWVGKPAPKPQQLQISTNGITIVAEPSVDSYVLLIELRDQVGGNLVRLIRELKVIRKD